MAIEILIDKINQLLTMDEAPGLPSKADSKDVQRFKTEVQNKYNYTIPSVFQKLLSYSNGIMFNGLTIWPTEKYWLFQESFMDANSNLREFMDDRFLYFGNRDEELYIFNPNEMAYQAIDYISDTAWEEFDNFEAMIEFMLKRALDLEN